jgi:hypothetical protein
MPKSLYLFFILFMFLEYELGNVRKQNLVVQCYCLLELLFPDRITSVVLLIICMKPI